MNDPNCSLCHGTGEYESYHNGDPVRCGCKPRPPPRALVVGDRVRRKPGSGYTFESEVVAIFQTRWGSERLVVESLKEPGMFRVFMPGQMELM